ncbi:hypothetical protein PMAYCL1PPCAC_06797 [Pristionchus mayeri]|uniref:Uncharacterized protein n=1 Tax=Pristionchus mayeri TaxID=1317129 RepID=A0AAN5CB52_9BILA|nr:hypothetical protein PMAYCL1PPCAC_06797 [Pristionchus mayeri]
MADSLLLAPLSLSHLISIPSDVVMIGMMNAGTEAVEFYTPRIQSSLYKPAVKKSSYTYTSDGRVLYNGNSDDSLLLWRQLLLRVFLYRLVKDLKKAESGFLPALRRFSQRIGLTKRKKTSIEKRIILREEMNEVVVRPVQLQVFSCEPSRIPDRPTPSSPSTPLVTNV